jgi:hypothetical protein
MASGGGACLPSDDGPGLKMAIVVDSSGKWLMHYPWGDLPSTYPPLVPKRQGLSRIWAG